MITNVLSILLAMGLVILVSSLAFSLFFFKTIYVPFIIIITLGVFFLYLCKEFIYVRTSIINRQDDFFSVIVITGATALGIFLYGNQFEYQSIWGDIGVYLYAASHFRDGGTLPFSLNSIGIDIIPNAPIAAPLGMVNPNSEGMFQFHGLPVWPALMAFSSLSIDGRELLAILFSINIILFYSIARSLSNSPKASFLATLIFSCSPLAWHQAVYATAEMLMAGIFLSGIFLAIKSRSVFLSGLALFALGTVHMGAILLSPILAIILLFLSTKGGRAFKKKLAYLGLAYSIGGFLAYRMSLYLSEKYANTVANALFGGVLELGYLVAVMPLVVVFPYLIREIYSRKISASRTRLGNHYLYTYAAQICIFVGFSLLILLQSYLLGWTSYYVPESIDSYSSWSARAGYANQGIKSLQHLSIWNIFLGGSAVGLLAFIFVPFICKGKSVKSLIVWVIAAAFIFFFGIYRPDIPNNFYASRYFFPILIVCLFMLSVFLFKFIPKSGILVIPVLLFSAIFNGATIGAGFFQGDRAFRDFLQVEIPVESSGYFYGSDWLRFHLLPILLSHATVNTEQDNKNRRENDDLMDLLVTDSNKILGGNGKCYRFVERRIPWQIAYPRVPELKERNVCVYQSNRTIGDTLYLKANSWMVNGEFEFVVVGSRQSSYTKIGISSLGWWSEKIGFKQSLENLQPKLWVCGEEFKLLELSPKLILFSGNIDEKFCRASFTTNTFGPAEIGEGEDRRRLGMDIYKIEVSPAKSSDW